MLNLGEKACEVSVKLLIYIVVYKIIVFWAALLMSVFWWNLQV